MQGGEEPLLHDTYLFVKDLQGKTQIISFAPPFVTVGNIKKHIEAVTRIPIDQQRLIFNGRQVDDTFNMQPHVTMHLLLRLCGGVKNAEGKKVRFTDPKPSSWQDDACHFSAQQAQAGAEDLFAATSALPKKTTKPSSDGLFPSKPKPRTGHCFSKETIGEGMDVQPPPTVSQHSDDAMIEDGDPISGSDREDNCSIPSDLEDFSQVMANLCGEDGEAAYQWILDQSTQSSQGDELQWVESDSDPEPEEPSQTDYEALKTWRERHEAWKVWKALPKHYKSAIKDLQALEAKGRMLVFEERSREWEWSIEGAFYDFKLQLERNEPLSQGCGDVQMDLPQSPYHHEVLGLRQAASPADAQRRWRVMFFWARQRQLPRSVIDKIGVAKELADPDVARKYNAMLKCIPGVEMGHDLGPKFFKWPIGRQWWRGFLTQEELQNWLQKESENAEMENKREVPSHGAADSNLAPSACNTQPELSGTQSTMIPCTHSRKTQLVRVLRLLPVPAHGATPPPSSYSKHPQWQS